MVFAWILGLIDIGITVVMLMLVANKPITISPEYIYFLLVL